MVIALVAVACGGGGGSDAARIGQATTTSGGTAGATTGTAAATTTTAGKSKVTTIPGMPPVVNPNNLYSEAGANMLSDEVKGDLAAVYVPNLQSNNVSVIDPSTMKVVDTIPVGVNPQHIVPSYDLRTLWVTNNAEGRTDGSLTPIDPKTGTAGPSITVDDPYNMYFTADGKSAIVVAEARKRLDFRDPHTMALQAVARHTRVRRHQPRRLLHRRHLRDFHLRVRRQARQGRHGEQEGPSATSTLSGGGECPRTSAPSATARPSTSRR